VRRRNVAKIEVELFGALKRDKKENKFTLSLKKEKSIKNVLLEDLNFPEEHIRFFVCMINDNQAKVTHILRDGEKLKVLLPVGGG